MSSTTFRGEKLVGRSNYIEWLPEAEIYLKVQGYMPYIKGTISKPNKSLYYHKEEDGTIVPKSDELAIKFEEKEEAFTYKNSQALAAIQSTISLNNLKRYSDIDTASLLWSTIKKDFSESSLELVARYYKKIITARYNNFKNIDEYISEIQSSAIYLKVLGQELSDSFILVTIYSSLPSSFDSFISRKYEAIGNNLASIDLDQLISDLISEEARMNLKDLDLEANKVTKKRGSICTHCNKSGHIRDKCFILHPELKRTSNKDSNSKDKSSKKDSKEAEKTTSTKVIMSAIHTSYSTTPSVLSSNKLVLDSGASNHFTPNKDWLLNFEDLSSSITVANKTKAPLLGKGDIPILYKGRELLLTGVYYVPSLATTLVSAHALADKGWTISLNKDNTSIAKEDIIVKAYWNSNAYYLNDLSIDYSLLEKVVYSVNTSIKEENLTLLHKRLNHLSPSYLAKTIESTLGYSLGKDAKIEDCESCYLGKFTKKVSYLPLKSPSEILSYFDVDIAGPFRVKGPKGEAYILTFTCRKTRVVYIYNLKYKTDAIDKLIELNRLLKRQFETSIKGIHLDNAKEFKGSKWDSYTKKEGIYNDYISPYSQEQNGIAERLNRYIIEHLLSIIHEKTIPLYLWPYIVKSIIHIKNRTYNSTIKKTPYEAITGQKPDITYIRTLGSLCYYLKPKEVRTQKGDLGKLAYKANKGILVGFESSNNYLVYDFDKKIVVSVRDITIKEDLEYKKDYRVEEDYTTLLEPESEDYNSLIELGSKSKNKSKNNLLSTPTPSAIPSPIPTSRANSPIIGDNRPPIESSNTSTTSESSSESSSSEEEGEKELRPRVPINYSTARPYKKKASLALNTLKKKEKEIYLQASQAYLSTKIEGDSTREVEGIENSTSNKVTIKKPSTPILEPRTYEEAISPNNPYKDYWVKSMQIELETLEGNNTWKCTPELSELSEAPEHLRTPTTQIPNTSLIKTRWVYKVKDLNNSYLELKSRFVAKGFEQYYGRDYLDSYAGVIKQIAWKLVFAIAILNSLIIYKIDIVSAFTHGNIDVNHLYIKPPKGLGEYLTIGGYSLENSSKVEGLLLNKALYGLKQSARIWYFTLTKVLASLGYKALATESCLWVNKDLKTIISIYVDDLAIIAPSVTIAKDLIKELEKHFIVKDLGLLKDYLGIEVDVTEDKVNKVKSLKLSQRSYISKVLAKYSLTSCNPIYTPMDTKAKLVPNKEVASKEDIRHFQEIVGSLLYITLGTRLDIAFPTIRLARYASNPSKEHFTAIKRVLRYLKTTIDYGITYYSNSTSYITGYTDSDFAGDIATAKSTSGYIFTIAGGPFMWRSKLQSIIAQSTTEAEYIALNLASKEAIYIRALAKELGYYSQAKFPIYIDNKSAIDLSENPVFHERTKHINVKFHYIRDLINKGIIDLIYINTEEQKADGFTKALDKVKYKRFLKQIGFE
jgi:hypothetical protein